MDAARDIEAHHKIDTHEKVCAERYGNLWEAVKRIESGMAADRVSRAAGDHATHDRFNTISNRMWWAMAAVATAGVGAFGALGFHLLTRGKI